MQQLSPAKDLSSKRQVHLVTKEQRQSNIAFLVVCLLFALLGFGISLQGEFPINDDYLYSYAVRTMLETGRFEIPGTVALSVFPIYAGAFFCKLFGGFSYSTLRLFSYLFGLFGGVGLYCALRELKLKPRDAALFSAAYLFNPLLVNVCFGFMTDVPALSMNNWLLYFGLVLSRPVHSEKASDSSGKQLNLPALIGTLIAATIAVGSRQTSLALLPALLMPLCRKGLKLPVRFVLFLALIAWPVFFYKQLEPFVLSNCKYLTSYEGYRQFFQDVLLNLVRSPSTGLTVLWQQAAKVVLYLGLFTLPLSLMQCLSLFRTENRQLAKLWLKAFAVALPLVSIPVGILLGQHDSMPFSENLFCPPAVGTYCIISGGVPGWSENSKIGLTIFATVCGALFLSMIPLSAAFVGAWKGKQSDRHANTGVIANRAPKNSNTTSSEAVTNVTAADSAPPVNSSTTSADTAATGESLDQQEETPARVLFTVLSAVTVIAFLVVQTSVMNLDRYYLLGLAPSLLLFGLIWTRIRDSKALFVGAVAALLMYGYSFATTLDCMSFQRVRWKAIGWLVDQGISPLLIDGGPEFNSTNNMRLCEGYRMDKGYVGWPDELRGGAPRNQWRWWPISSEKYIVAGSKLDDYSVVKTMKYWSPLKFRNRELYILRQNGKSQGLLEL